MPRVPVFERADTLKNRPCRKFPTPWGSASGSRKPIVGHFSGAFAPEKWPLKSSPPLGTGLGVGENVRM